MTEAAELGGPMRKAETRLCDHFRVQFLLLWIPWAGRQCRVPRRCLEENAGEREQNKRKRPGEDRWRQRIRQE